MIPDHPIDTEALRREALGQLGLAAMDPRWPGRVLSILDALAAAEHRATRAEAQSEARRIDIEYWQGVARGNAIAADVWKESAEEAEARIKAVQEVLDKAEDRGPIGLAFDGTPFPAFVSSADIHAALDS